ncbi:enoyl-CoA hydratase-related protein [Microbaculum marinum]|uniref:Enoyl-CoA hydratase-related protein n=1 Tax=Microbaculum marinum TaxID=1764581 RepID=A0AAW9RVW1_9HYPH
MADRLAVVTLDRSDHRNAITLAMWHEIGRVFADLSATPPSQVRAIILTGAGDHFSTGADIAEFGAVRNDAGQARAYERAVEEASDAIFGAPQPTIATIRGYCLGGACHLAMACDFRVAEPGARIGIPSAKLSIVYGINSTRRLAALVGIPAAKRILFGGARFDSEEGLKLGFLDRLGSSADDEARALAAEFADSAPLSIRGAKAILNGLAMDALDMRAVEDLIAQASDSRDYREAREAFAAKRKPVFEGR